MDKWPVIKHEYVEIPIPADQAPNQINLPDLPNLRYVHLLGITAYTSTQFPKGAISGEDVVTETEASDTYLTLELYNGKQFLNDCPLMNFFDMFQSNAVTGGLFVNWARRGFNGQRVNWPKSFVQIPNLTQAATIRVIVLSIWYQDPAEVEKKDRAAEFNKQS